MYHQISSHYNISLQHLRQVCNFESIAMPLYRNTYFENQMLFLKSHLHVTVQFTKLRAHVTTSAVSPLWIFVPQTKALFILSNSQAIAQDFELIFNSRSLFVSETNFVIAHSFET